MGHTVPRSHQRSHGRNGRGGGEHVGRPATVLRGPRSCDGRIAKVCIYEGEKKKKPDTLYSNIDRGKFILEYKVSSVIIIIKKKEDMYTRHDFRKIY